MVLDVERYGAEGTTVPYGKVFDGVRKNSGFIDIRGRPDLAATIPEGAESQALRRLLIRLAADKVYFSLGCDLGEHEEPESPATRRYVAGGYIQLTSIRYREASTEQHDDFATAIEKSMRERSRGKRWRMWLEGRWVNFRLGRRTKAPTTWVWFFALERSKLRALEERENMIEALSETLHTVEVVGTLKVHL